jgi:transposase
MVLLCKVAFSLRTCCFKLGDGIQAVKGKFRICSPFRISGFEEILAVITLTDIDKLRNIVTHITGPSRHQTTLFPESLDELIAQDHPVRVIDAFVDSLDLGQLGFRKVVAEATGRPPYAPGDLLKLYVYGYLNRVRSSRMIERETKRNIEVMWLVNRVSATYKTIADFRRGHASAIVGVCREFIRFCRGQSCLAVNYWPLTAPGSRRWPVASR